VMIKNKKTLDFGKGDVYLPENRNDMLNSGNAYPKLRIYLDNCCYNRPYDDQSQLRISLETQAKLHIQKLIVSDYFELTSSYMLDYECSRNPYEMRRRTIRSFLDKIYSSVS